MNTDRDIKGEKGRQSIQYASFDPIQDTTSIFLLDNKAKDIEILNTDPKASHSHYSTNIVQQQDLDFSLSSGREIILDQKTNWTGTVEHTIKSVLVNVTTFYKTDFVTVVVMTEPDVYTEHVINIPEGNYTVNDIIDFLNYALFQLYIVTLRIHGRPFSEFGVKFDTRNMSLGVNPITNLVEGRSYSYVGYHPDLILLPNCSVDFSNNRVNNFLGIRKQDTYVEGFKITYDDLVGGNVPALLNVPVFEATGNEVPLDADPNGVSYLVQINPDTNLPETRYRSWYLAYNVANSICKKKFLLCDPDVTGGITQLYHSLPDALKPPVTMLQQTTDETKYPIHYTSHLPFEPKELYNPSAVYSQLITDKTRVQSNAFNRMPLNEIMIQAPALSYQAIAINRLLTTKYAAMPLMNKLKAVQRVITTDDLKRSVPYITKNMFTLHPSASSVKYY